MLGAGTYHQDTDVIIPDNINHFSIIGQGPKVTNLYFHGDYGIKTTHTEFLDAANWTTTGWTGSWAAGWTHTPGNTSALSHDHPAEVGVRYTIHYVVTGSNGLFSISFGGKTLSGLSESGVWPDSNEATPAATTTAPLVITPGTGCDETIIVSIRKDNRIKGCIIRGFSMEYGGAATGASDGIHILGDWINDRVTTYLQISDIEQHYGSHFWAAGIRIINATCPMIDKVFIRPYSSWSGTELADGIVLESVMGGTISNSTIVGGRYAIDGLRSSERSLIKNYKTNHGTEAIRITNVLVGGKIGIRIGVRGYAWQITNVEGSGCSDGMIVENDYANDELLGGYHSVSNCTFDTGGTADTAWVWLQRPGTSVVGCNFKRDDSYLQHMIYAEGRAWQTVFANNIFRDVADGYACIYLNGVGQSNISGNNASDSGSTTGYFLYMTSGSNYNLYNSNTYLVGGGGRVYTDAAAYNNSGNHNMVL
jgi:hypothetical protein